MVDFQNETTVSTPASELVRILILERRYNLMEIIEKYLINDSLNVDGGSDIGVIKARLRSLYFELSESLPRQMSKEEIAKLEKGLESDKFEILLDCFKALNKVLDGIKLTRIDTKKKYDSSKVETENKMKGL